MINIKLIIYISAIASIALLSGLSFFYIFDLSLLLSVVFSSILFINALVVLEIIHRRQFETTTNRRLLALKRLSDSKREQRQTSNTAMSGVAPITESSKIPLVLTDTGLTPANLAHDEANKQANKTEATPNNVDNTVSNSAKSLQKSADGKKELSWADGTLIEEKGQNKDGGNNEDGDAPSPAFNDISNDKEMKAMSNLLQQLQTQVEKVAAKGSDANTNIDEKDSQFSEELPRILDNNQDTETKENIDKNDENNDNNPKNNDGGIAAQEQSSLHKVQERLNNDGLNLFAQPIVDLNSQTAKFYECFGVIRDSDGQIIPPNSYLSAALKAGLIGIIDNILLLRIINQIRCGDDDVKYFFNISPMALAEPGFLQMLLSNLENLMNDDGKEVLKDKRLAFEIPVNEIDMDFKILNPNIKKLYQAGFEISLEDVRRFDQLVTKTEELKKINCHYIKISSKHLSDLVESHGIGDIVRDIERFRECNIDIIVDKVENGKMVKLLQQMNISYAQGVFFGKPRLCDTTPKIEAMAS